MSICRYIYSSKPITCNLQENLTYIYNRFLQEDRFYPYLKKIPTVQITQPLINLLVVDTCSKDREAK